MKNKNKIEGYTNFDINEYVNELEIDDMNLPDTSGIDIDIISRKSIDDISTLSTILLFVLFIFLFVFLFLSYLRSNGMKGRSLLTSLKGNMSFSTKPKLSSRMMISPK